MNPRRPEPTDETPWGHWLRTELRSAGIRLEQLGDKIVAPGNEHPIGAQALAATMNARIPPLWLRQAVADLLGTQCMTVSGDQSVDEIYDYLKRFRQGATTRWVPRPSPQALRHQYATREQGDALRILTVAAEFEGPVLVSVPRNIPETSAYAFTSIFTTGYPARTIVIPVHLNSSLDAGSAVRSPVAYDASGVSRRGELRHVVGFRRNEWASSNETPIEKELTTDGAWPSTTELEEHSRQLRATTRVVYQLSIGDAASPNRMAIETIGRGGQGREWAPAEFAMALDDVRRRLAHVRSEGFEHVAEMWFLPEESFDELVAVLPDAVKVVIPPSPPEKVLEGVRIGLKGRNRAAFDALVEHPYMADSIRDGQTPYELADALDKRIAELARVFLPPRMQVLPGAGTGLA